MLTPRFGRNLLPRAAVLLILILLASLMFGKSKDDVVVMKNGDRFTGEIKSLQHGELLFKASYMTESVHLDWKRVERLESTDSYVITLTNGTRIEGSIDRVRSSDINSIQTGDSESGERVQQEKVIAIQQNEVNFWNQFTGSINYGFSFTSANSSTSSSLGADLARYTSKNSVQISTSSQFDSQSKAKSANRFTFDSQYGRMLSRTWFAAGIFSLLKSNQQDLNLRSTYGSGMGRKLFQTDKTSLTALAGGVYTHESYFAQAGTEPIHNNAEALLALRFYTFRFRTMDVNSSLSVFPSLSDQGRLRFSSQSNLSFELVRNFYWGFQLYDNYDSRPPVNAPKNDLGITTSVGWKF